MIRKPIQPYFDRIMSSFLAANHVPQNELIPLMRSVAEVIDRLANEPQNAPSDLLPPDVLAVTSLARTPESLSWEGLYQRLRETYRAAQDA